MYINTLPCCKTAAPVVLVVEVGAASGLFRQDAEKYLQHTDTDTQGQSKTHCRFKLQIICKQNHQMFYILLLLSIITTCVRKPQPTKAAIATSLQVLRMKVSCVCVCDEDISGAIKSRCGKKWSHAQLFSRVCARM